MRQATVASPELFGCAMGKNAAARPAPKQPDARAVNQRGQEWQAKKLTGKSEGPSAATCVEVLRAGRTKRRLTMLTKKAKMLG